MDSAELIIQNILNINTEITHQHVTAAIYKIISKEDVSGNHRLLSIICNSNLYFMDIPFAGSTLLEHFCKNILRNLIKAKVQRTLTKNKKKFYLDDDFAGYVNYIEAYIPYLWGTNEEPVGDNEYIARKNTLKLYLDASTGVLANLPSSFDNCLRCSYILYGFDRLHVDGKILYKNLFYCIDNS